MKMNYHFSSPLKICCLSNLGGGRSVGMANEGHCYWGFPWICSAGMGLNPLGNLIKKKLSIQSNWLSNKSKVIHSKQLIKLVIHQTWETNFHRTNKKMFVINSSISQHWLWLSYGINFISFLLKILPWQHQTDNTTDLSP